MNPNGPTETHGFCEQCKSSYRRSYPHACAVLSIGESRSRLEAWFGGEVAIYE